MNKKTVLKLLVVFTIGNIAGNLFENLTGKPQCSKEGFIVALMLGFLLVAVDKLVDQIKLRKTIKE